MDSWKVKIIDKGYTDTKDIFLYCQSGNKIYLVQKGGETIEEYIEDGTEKEPSFRLNSMHLQAFSNAISELGINPTKEYTQGKLEATEKHLEDMRKLLKIIKN